MASVPSHSVSADALRQVSIEVPYNIAAIYQAKGRYDEAAQTLLDLLKKSEKADGSAKSACVRCDQVLF